MIAARELDALLLDAGNTVVFLDMRALAEIVRAAGHDVTAEQLQAVEGAAKREYERSLTSGADHARGWDLYFVALFGSAGVRAPESLLPAVHAAHLELNLWRRVPRGLPAALAKARSLGLRLGIVSNSEGRLRELFEHVGLADAFEIVVDSAHEGVRKPDPEIFRRALRRMGVPTERALYAGDIPDVDVAGAYAAGMHAALIDPLGFYPGHAPRYASVAELVDAIAAEA